jgi:hypothetical protein
MPNRFLGNLRVSKDVLGKYILGAIFILGGTAWIVVATFFPKLAVKDANTRQLSRLIGAKGARVWAALVGGAAVIGGVLLIFAWR